MRYKAVLPFLTKLVYFFFGKNRLHNSPSALSCTPFFILGTGRNGSTLLSMILNGHSKIFIPNEQYALHYAAIRYQLYNFLIWRDLVKLVVGEFADSCNNQDWRTDFNNLYNKLYNLPKKERSFQRIIDEIILEHSKQMGNVFTIWGDKSLPTIWYLNYVFRIYPDSKYIFLIKDGRDVVSSFFKAGEESFEELSKIDNAAKHWIDAIKKWRWLKEKANPNQLFEIKYEDLVTNPTVKIKEILKFLNMEYEDGILNFHDIVKKRQLFNPVHKSLSKPINSDSIGAWKKNISEEQLSVILPILESGLKEYGYL